MSATKAKAPQAGGGYVGVVFRNRRYPNHRQRLPELGAGYSVKFRGGNYTTKTPEEEAALRKLRRKGIAPYAGVPIYECGLCPFHSYDAEEVEWHRKDNHSVGQLLADAEAN